MTPELDPLVIKSKDYTPAFITAAKFILPHETEFVRGHFNDWEEEAVRTENDPNDPGGTTRYGIDQRSHPNFNIKALTLENALNIYWEEWLRNRLDLLPDRLAIAAFDVYVNGGYPIKWLQHGYNETHLDTKHLVEDNRLGPLTLTALKSGNQDAILRFFFKERDQHLIKLAEQPRFAGFLKGWIARDTDLEKVLNVYYPPVPGQRKPLA